MCDPTILCLSSINPELTISQTFWNDSRKKLWPYDKENLVQVSFLTSNFWHRFLGTGTRYWQTVFGVVFLVVSSISKNNVFFQKWSMTSSFLLVYPYQIYRLDFTFIREFSSKKRPKETPTNLEWVVL